MNINNLPQDILYNIISNVFKNNPPLLTYTLKYLNKSFYNIIHNNKFILSNILDNFTLIDHLCLNANINIFKWLCDNNYNINYNNILLLIEYNRLDLLNLLMEYNHYHNKLFNRFYLTDTNLLDNFTIFDLASYNKSYITHSIDHNNLNIFKFFIENNKYKIYYNKLPKILNIVCLKGNDIFLKYILNNYNDIIDKSTIKDIIININNNNISIENKDNILEILENKY